MSRSDQDVGEELLDFEVQSPVKKIKVESPELAKDTVAATKVRGGNKIELDVEHLEDGEVKVEEGHQGNLEDGEISEDEGGGENGRKAEMHKKRICRHFAAGRTCLWGQVPFQGGLGSPNFPRIAGSCICRKGVSGETIPCSLLEVQPKLL